MLVGTNNAIRISALRAVGGLSDSITEDMATGLKFHTRRNAASGRRWKSVYTPDVLAVGEGPSSLGRLLLPADALVARHVRGAAQGDDLPAAAAVARPGAALHPDHDVLPVDGHRLGARRGQRLPLPGPGRPGHGRAGRSCGSRSTSTRPRSSSGSTCATAATTSARTSPRVRSGIKGMLMSIFAAPIFAASLIATILRLPAKFVVTPKGLSSSAGPHPDLPPPPAVGGAAHRRDRARDRCRATPRPAVLLWPAVALAACLAPPVLCLVERIVGRQPAIDAAPPAVLPDGRSGITTESLERAALDALLAAGTATRRSPRPEAGPQASGRGEADRTGAVSEGDLPAGWVRTASLAGRDRRAGADGAPKPTPRDGRPDRPTPDRPTPDRPTPDGRPTRAVATPATTPPSWTRRRRRRRCRGRGPRRARRPSPVSPDRRASPASRRAPDPTPVRRPRRAPASRRPAAGTVRRPAGTRPPGGAPGPRPRPTPRPAPSPSPAPPVRPGERPAAAEHGGRYVAPAAEHQGAVPPPPAPRPDGRPGEAPVGRPTPPSPAPRPDAAPGRGPDADPAPRPASRAPADAALHRRRSSRPRAREAVMPVSVGSSIGNETAKRHDGRDGGSRAPDAGSVNAPTVAVRVVALAAVAGPAAARTRGGAAGPRRATDGGELIEQGLDQAGQAFPAPRRRPRGHARRERPAGLGVDLRAPAPAADQQPGVQGEVRQVGRRGPPRRPEGQRDPRRRAPDRAHPPHRRLRQQGGHVQRGDLQEPRLRPRDGT